MQDSQLADPKRGGAARSLVAPLDYACSELIFFLQSLWIPFSLHRASSKLPRLNLAQLDVMESSRAWAEGIVIGPRGEAAQARVRGVTNQGTIEGFEHNTILTFHRKRYSVD